MNKLLKSYSLHNFKTIAQLENIPEDMLEAIEIVGRVLPFKTNNYVIDELIDWSQPESDPIFTLNFPRAEMLDRKHYQTLKKMINEGVEKQVLDKKIHEIRLELNPNPAGQEQNVPTMNEIKLKGIQHKYPETVLFFPSQGQTCHAYCTFCFRWPQFTGMSGLKFAMKEVDLLMKYLQIHKQVSDVLFTGGDPMTMNSKTLRAYIEPLLEPGYEHIRTIRIGTKSLAYWPYRYLTDPDSEDIIALFKKIVASGKNLSIQAHFNHPTELSTEAVKNAIAVIRSTGAQIRTQSPLLKHINEFSSVVADTAKNRTVHKITNYIQELAAYFHSFYGELKVNDPSNPALTQQRLNLLVATQITLKNALNLVGVSAPEQM